MTPSKQQPKISRILVALSLTAACLVGAHQTRAASSVMAGVVPFGTGGPSAYPNAFSGFGFTFAAEKYFLSSNSAISVRALTSGTATMVFPSFKKYFIKGPQLLKTTERNTPYRISMKHWSVFAETCLNLYSMSNTNKDSSILTATGLGAQVSLGAEYPLWWNAFSVLRFNYFNSLGGSSSAFYVDLNIGYPFSL